MIPRQIPRLIEKRIVVRYGNDPPRMPDLLPADAHLVPGDPQQRRLARHGRVVVRVALRLGRVDDVGEVAGHEPAHCVVVRVFVRAEEFGEEVWFLVGRSEGEAFFAGGGDGGAATVFGRVLVAVAGQRLAVFEGQEGFFFGFEGFGEVDEEGVDGGVEGDVEEDDED